MHFQDPCIERLHFHLENEQQIILTDYTDLTKIVTKERVGITKCTQWMETNKMCEEARELTYAEFPLKWVWKKKEKKWGKTKKGRYAGMIYMLIQQMVKNTTCECYLTPAKDACLSKGTVNGVVHTSYKSACEAL